MSCQIFSLGYEKRTIKEFIEILQQADVRILLDVRESPWSYKMDFRKSTLQNELSKVGIQYQHITAAGNPKRIRTKYIKSTTILRKYKEYLDKTSSGLAEINGVIQHASMHNLNICLTCYERQHDCCHRSIILSALRRKNKTLKISHL